MLNLSHSPADKVFYYFEEICKIPHGSGNTKALSDYCVAFAKERNLEYHQDKYNNVIIIREAAPGYEDHKPYILQGHLDMVCEKNNDVEFDFEKDPLNIYVEDGFIKARGTTLGADDGIAIAFCLALLDKADLDSPRLECVFTVDEETTMLGAETVDLSVLKGRDLLNLDSESDNGFLCGCAGGISAEIQIPLEFESQTGYKYDLYIYDLEGGHSGERIHAGHGNPTIMLGRILNDLSKKYDIRLIDFQGGKKGNAIPRDSRAVFVGTESQRNEVEAALREWMEVLKCEYVFADPEMKYDLQVEDVSEYRCYTENVFHRILKLLVLIPDGVVTMSKAFEGHVESSTNTGICNVNEERFSIHAFVRSNVYSKKIMITDKLKALAELVNGIYHETHDYPAWEFKRESSLRENVGKIYKEVYGTEARMDIIHAGLECGLFQEKMKDLDCISFGPTTHGIHTPKECLDIASVKRVWNFILRLLEYGNPC